MRAGPGGTRAPPAGAVPPAGGSTSPRSPCTAARRTARRRRPQTQERSTVRNRPPRAPSHPRRSPSALRSRSSAQPPLPAFPTFPTFPSRPPPQHPFLSLPLAHLPTPRSRCALLLVPSSGGGEPKGEASLPTRPLSSWARRQRPASLGWASEKQLSLGLEKFPLTDVTVHK